MLALCTQLLDCKNKSAPPPPGPSPPARALAVPKAALYVTNNGSDSLSIVDLDSEEVLTRALPSPAAVHLAPHHLGLYGSKLLVPFAYPDEVAAAPTSKHRDHGRSQRMGQLALIDADTLAVEAQLPLEENPGEIVLSPDGTRALVTHFDMQRALREAAAGSVPAKLYASLLVFSTQPFARIAARAICVAPHGMAIAESGKTALVACYGSDELAIVDLTSPALATARVPIAGSAPVLGVPRFGPYSVTLNPAGSMALVAELEGSELRYFDIAGRAFAPTEPLALGARAMMPCFQSAARAFVPVQSPDGLARVNPATWTFEKRQAFGAECTRPHVAACGANGRVFVACEGDHKAPGNVVEVDGETLAVKRSWTVGVYPDGLAFRLQQ